MWPEFWLATLVGMILIFPLAFIVLRSFRFSKVAAAACAPIISILLYAIFAIAYGKLGIWTDGWLLFASSFMVIILVVGAVLIARKRSLQIQEPREKVDILSKIWDIETRYIVLYLAVGIIVGSYVFLCSLSTADCTSYNYDDYSHLAYIQSFLDRGNYSSLAANYQYDTGWPDTYYPAAWHMLVASVVSICEVPNYVAANAILFISCAMIYPLSCLFLMSRIFGNDNASLIAGAFFTLAFAAFPWEFIYYGRLVSNLLAFCSAPAMLACTLVIFGKDEAKQTRVRFAVVLFASFALSIFTQPSVCFTWLFLSVPYLMHVIWNLKGKTGIAPSVKTKILRVVAFCLVVFVFLIGCYMLPFLYEVTRFKWRAPMTPIDALGIVAFQSYPAEGFSPSPGSPVLALLVLVGIIFALQRKETRWIVLLYGILAVMYVVSAGTNLRLKNYMTGWWYTDSHRVLAMFAMASYCLAAYGAGRLSSKLFSRCKDGRREALLQGCFSAFMATLALLPSFSVGTVYAETEIGTLKDRISGIYSVETTDENSMYSRSERDFVRRAAEITGDAKVFNIPKDGSMFAYQSSGMKTLFRWDLDSISNDPETRLIQRSLDDITSNSSIRRAVDDLGLEYVLMLDYGHEPFALGWGGCSYIPWNGVVSIDEETPGFELVLSEGDMRLYRILSEEETQQKFEQSSL